MEHETEELTVEIYFKGNRVCLNPGDTLNLDEYGLIKFYSNEFGEADAMRTIMDAQAARNQRMIKFVENRVRNEVQS
jgi:hypothetical protein